MSNKVVLITGSSNGIGATTAVHFAQAGYDVVVCYKSKIKAAEAVMRQVEAFGVKGLLVQVGVSDEASVRDMFEKVEREWGRLDVLVNNAAVDWANPIESAHYEKDWRTIIGTKLDGSYLATKYAIPLLKKSKSAQIIYVVSSMYYKVDVADPAYCVATAGVVTLMKCMVKALAPYGIRVNGVGPGDTRGTGNAYYEELGNTERMWQEIAEKNPLGRVTTPQDVAETILTVVEEPTGYWNGNIVYVNGGSHIG